MLLEGSVVIEFPNNMSQKTRSANVLDDSRLIMVSNRGPVEHSIDDVGLIRSKETGGGVAVALASVARSCPVTWIAGAASAGDRVVARSSEGVSFAANGKLRLVDLPEEVRVPFYESFCNPVLWFVQHSLNHLLEEARDIAAIEAAWLDGYRPANELFAEAVIDEIGPDEQSSRVMLHDYHLYLAPRMIREARPGIAMQQFIHIPWPDPLAWLMIPHALVSEICQGLLANDSIQFQTEKDAALFMATCRAYLGENAEVCERRGEVEYLGRVTSVSVNPISVDVAELEQLSVSPEVRLASAALAICCPGGTQLGGSPYAHSSKRTDNTGRMKTIVRVDRLDPSKNILRGFQAYERMLDQSPALRGKVRFLAHLVPSRTGIAEYDGYASKVFSLIRQINDCYGTEDWQPITVFYKQDRLSALASLRAYDVLLVNSVADGMNLVSKEGPILNTRDGVLVLSRTAGSYEELAADAIGIEPLDVEETALALSTALKLPDEDRALRAAGLRTAIEAHQLSDWLEVGLKDLQVSSIIHQVEAGLSEQPALPRAVMSKAG